MIGSRLKLSRYGLVVLILFAALTSFSFVDLKKKQTEKKILESSFFGLLSSFRLLFIFQPCNAQSHVAFTQFSISTVYMIVGNLVLFGKKMFLDTKGGLA